MKFYLSSYKLGRERGRLKRMLPKNRRTAYIANSCDCYADKKRTEKGDRFNFRQLKSVGLKPEKLDLRDYFGKRKELERKLREFGVIWVRGGNTFVLRQAMRLSGFDAIFKKLVKKRNMLYGGYSAGICILSPSLHGLELVDDKSQRPYGKRPKLIWEGLGAVDYAFAPHYRSRHPESRMVNKTIQYYINHKIPFIALRDGDVVIIE